MTTGWETPEYAAEAWQEVWQDLESAGDAKTIAAPARPYYHNTVSDKVSWTKPDETAWITYHEDL